MKTQLQMSSDDLKAIHQQHAEDNTRVEVSWDKKYLIVAFADTFEHVEVYVRPVTENPDKSRLVSGKAYFPADSIDYLEDVGMQEVYS